MGSGVGSPPALLAADFLTHSHFVLEIFVHESMNSVLMIFFVLFIALEIFFAMRQPLRQPLPKPHAA